MFECNKTKEEILEIIVKEFNKANEEFYEAQQRNDTVLEKRLYSRFATMSRLIHELGIQEKK